MDVLRHLAKVDAERYVVLLKIGEDAARTVPVAQMEGAIEALEETGLVKRAYKLGPGGRETRIYRITPKGRELIARIAA